jgi:DNA-binding CsgD family transcriptional regulator
LLERERELALVSRLVEAAAAGEFELAVVEGPAGAGKSAILNVLAARACEREMRVLRATGLELEREYPFGVVRQLFEPLVYELDRAARRDVFAGAAALAESLLTDRAAQPGPRLADAGFALIHSLHWALVGLTDLGPLALVVDDLQWADPSSLRFVAFALRRCEGLPLLVALARRDGPASEQSAGMSAVLSGPASVIRPAPLSGAAVATLLAEAVGRELGDGVVGEAERVTEGNPLYVRELADSLAAADNEAAEVPLALLRGAAPAAVGRRVQTAMGRLDGATQALARAAAILGDEVPLRRAAALAGVEHGHAGVAADALVRGGILVVGEPLRFRHPLVRQAVLESIEPRARARAHGLAARLLIAEGEPPERAAVHLLESDPAGDPEVVGTLRAAARRAIAEGAPELAISVLRRALREPPAGRERPFVLKELAIAEGLLGNEEAVGLFEEAFAIAGSVEGIADGAVPYAWLLMVRGRLAEAEALIDRVCGAIGDRDRRLMLEAELGAMATYTKIRGARGRLARAAAGLRGETPAERLLLGLRAIDAVNAGAIGAVDAARPVSSALGDERLLEELGSDSPTYLQLLGVLGTMDELDLLERELVAAVANAQRRGATMCLATASTLRGLIAWRRGQLVTAEEETRTGVEVITQMGWLAGYPWPLAVLVEVLSEVGDLVEADRLLEENNLGGPLPDGFAFVELLGARGCLRLSQGKTKQGIEDLKELRTRLAAAGDGAPHLHALLAQSLVPALVQAGREQQAREIADEALRVARAFGPSRYIAHGLRGRAIAHPDGPDLGQLHAAAAVFEQIRAPIDLARTLLDIGSALRRRRRPAAARDPLRRALDLARVTGARPLAERAQHELRAAGARPRRDRITGRDALTATERRIAELATEGMTNRQIAEALFITRRTAESHLHHVFRKLGIHARGDLHRALTAQDKLKPG